MLVVGGEGISLVWRDKIALDKQCRQMVDFSVITERAVSRDMGINLILLAHTQY